MIYPTQLPSGNYYSPNEMGESDIYGVVNHGTQSDNVFSAIGWLRSPKSEVSSNYVISKSGKIYELVDWQSGKRAWANGVVDKEFYDHTIPWLVDCVKRKINPNWHTVSVEHEATLDDMLHARPMPDAQFNASIELNAYILRAAGLKAGHPQVLVHRQIAGRGKPYCFNSIFVPAYVEVLIDRNPDLKP